jgi:hypothetical protein
MRNFVLIMVLIIGSSLTLQSFTTEKNISVQTKYCEGWEDGYCEGWKDVKGPYAICPVTPICPIPKISCNEGYRCGYNRGFKAGMRAADD